MRVALALVFAVSGTAVAGELSDEHPAPQPSPCSQLGSGFAALVGTDTCLKIGGRIRADYLSSTFKQKPAADTPVAWQRPGSGFATSGTIVLDSRTRTDFGTMRTYVEVHTCSSRGLCPP